MAGSCGTTYNVSAVVLAQATWLISAEEDIAASKGGLSGGFQRVELLH